MEKWVQFARQNKYREFPPDAKHFSLYVTKLTEEGASYSTIKLLQSSMPFYYAARNSEALVVTKRRFVKQILSGAMRQAAKNRGPVKKATTFGEEEIKSFLMSVFWPTGSKTNPNPSLKDWRTATKLYLYYFTLCRFDCYSKLRKDSFEFSSDHIVIKYATRKNDQLYAGSESILKKRNDLLCPELILKTYFRIMGFKNGNSILNCRLTFNGKSSRPIAPLAYSQALKDTKDLTSRYGYEYVTEKSFKASGVTVLLDKNTPLHDVQVFGGWKSIETPMYYHNSSVKRRKEVSTAL